MIRNLVSPEKFAFARRLRQSPTPAEARAWSLFRCEKLGIKFRRQAIIRGWIVDFWIPQFRIAVEFDGSSHAGKQEEDARRDAAMAEIGVITLRFPNSDIFVQPDNVIERIRSAVETQRRFGAIPFHGRNFLHE